MKEDYVGYLYSGFVSFDPDPNLMTAGESWNVDRSVNPKFCFLIQLVDSTSAPSLVKRIPKYFKDSYQHGGGGVHLFSFEYHRLRLKGDDFHPSSLKPTNRTTKRSCL